MYSKVLMKSFITVLCLALLTACSGGSTEGTVSSGSTAEPSEASEANVVTGNKVGNRAPGFKLPLLDDSMVSLDELQGKPVLINFFATWCGPCMAEMPDIQKIYEAYGDTVHVLCIDVGETTETVQEFLAKGSYSFPVALDSEGTTTEPYGLTGIPQTYVLDSGGVIAWHTVGTSDYETFAAALDALL